jgi:hypothetical protein
LTGTPAGSGALCYYEDVQDVAANRISKFSNLNRTDLSSRSFQAMLFLWFDVILLESIGQYDKNRFIDSLIEHDPINRENHMIISDVVKTIDDVDKALAEVRRNEMLVGYPRWGKEYENYTYPEPKDPYEYAHNKLLAYIEKEKGVARFDGYDIEQAEGRARVAVDAVRLWDRVNRALPCILQAGTDEKLALQAAQAFGRSDVGITSEFGLFSVLVPSLEHVPWNSVVELKKSGSFSSLRRKIADVFKDAHGNFAQAQISFQRLEQETMSDIIERYRPRFATVALEALFSNLPGLPVNPFGLYTGAKSTLTEWQKRRNLSWFYVLRDLRRELPAASADCASG